MVGATKQILVVDDDPDLRENLEEILLREGFPVRGAGDGAAALEILATSEHGYLVLLDLYMPGMDGLAFLAELSRIHGERCLHRVVVISGAREPEAASRNPHVVAVLRKPFELDELVKLARTHCAPDAAHEKGAACCSAAPPRS